MPIGAFVAGVLVVESLGAPRLQHLVRRPLRVVITIEIALLAVVAALPRETPAGAVTVTVAFVAALQFSTFTTLDGSPYATVMTSGNLRQCVIAVRQWLTGHDHGARQRAQRYAAVVCAFTVGAMVGVICTRWLGTPAIAIASALLAAVLALLIRETRQLEQARTTPT